MSLAHLVAHRETGTFGTFEVAEGNVSKNLTPILHFFNATTALVPMNARSLFTTPDEHSAFDAALMGLPAIGVSVQYIETVAKFMDPKARFTDWIKGNLTPASVGLKLTPEELAVPSAYESAKAKFEAMFTPPTPPRKLDGRTLIDVEKLRIIQRSNKPYQLSNGDYTIGIGAAKKLWNDHLNAAWKDREATPTSSMAISSRPYIEAAGNERRVHIYPSYITIGCQTIQRNAIEAVALELGWDM